MFLFCNVARDIWMWLANNFGVNYLNSIQLLAFHGGWLIARSEPFRSLFMVIPVIALWCIWKASNASVFEDLRMNLDSIKSIIMTCIKDISHAHSFKGKPSTAEADILQQVPRKLT